ncbi:snoRNA-binding rRNA-processing protein imp4 [Diatrype stigma]|uniref:U3 small nucleolar ribonucleoprotein protein IMP4 n=1 Tax=Diatrype stigma TaxID=117547 RepID=A0AAN9UPI5_9PEZI
MIRKQARQRRDYLYRKALILRDAEISEKRAKLRASLATGKPLDPSIANDQQLRKDFAYDESRPDRTSNEELDLDDEYSQLSGIVDPRVLVTTSRDPSTRLAAFAKEIRLLLPDIDDTIEVRHHVFIRTGHDSVELSEVGPRLSMKLFEIRNGTLDNKDGDVEWHLNQYTRTSHEIVAVMKSVVYKGANLSTSNRIEQFRNGEVCY